MKRLPYRALGLFPKLYSHQTLPKCEDDKSHQSWKPTPKKMLIGASLAAFIAYKIFDYTKNQVSSQKQQETADHERKELPFYTLKEVAKHDEKNQRIWATYKQGVYDITDYVSEHPGGDQILLAAGSSLDPFWILHANHNNKDVLDLLETLRIGNLSLKESHEIRDDMEDPYVDDPKRHPALNPVVVKPFNAEVTSTLLAENFITPNDYFYIRNHLPVPDIDVKTYEIEVEIEGNNKNLILSLDDVKKFPKQTVTAATMCAGNRREEMSKVKPVKGLNWSSGAVGNAQWTGASLRDVLIKAGLTLDENTKLKHVQFEGYDLDTTGKPYGASIPLWRALDPKCDVILAYEMNGERLPPDHGYPVRVIIPGVAGARSVKWLGKIVVSEEESHCHYQRSDYKGFSPSTTFDNVDFTKSPPIYDLPVTSAICSPCSGDNVTVVDGHVVVKGYAWSGGGQRIIRVDITGDGGKNWHVADLEQTEAEPPRHWSWTLFTAKIPVPPGARNIELWCKAVDSCYNTQPETFENIYNFRGVLNNAYHRVPINLKFV